MNANYAKLSFGAVLNDVPMASDCHNYGSVGGCDEGCPALLRGECEVPYEAIKCCDIPEEDQKEILDLYARKGE